MVAEGLLSLLIVVAVCRAGRIERIRPSSYVDRQQDEAVASISERHCVGRIVVVDEYGRSTDAVVECSNISISFRRILVLGYPLVDLAECRQRCRG